MTAPDPRNRLNDLSNKKWIQETKSFWLSRPGPRDDLKTQHPATFAESDISRLIRFFTKGGDLVLDPFVGTGSALVACEQTGRQGVGIELIGRWADIARQRAPNSTIMLGDARRVLRGFKEESVDFVVTSPPYWSILNKELDHKTRAERVRRGLDTTYSEDPLDMGNIKSYELFLEEIGVVFAECLRVLRPGKYIGVIVSDFRHDSEYVMYHSDIAGLLQTRGFVLKGLIVLLQDDKNLYPYGMPYDYVPNIHHQYIVVARKP